MTLLNTVVVAIIAWLVNKKWASNVEFKKQAAVMCQIPRRIMWRVGMGMNEQCISDSMLDIHINEMRTAIDEEMPYGAKDLYRIMLVYKHLKLMRELPESQRLSHTSIVQQLCQQYLAWDFEGKLNPEFNMFDPKQF
jgi:hypothetical protein